MLQGKGVMNSIKDFLTGWLQGALSNLRQFLATEIFLIMMKNAFYFIWKALLGQVFVLKNDLKKKDKINFKIYNVTNWLINNCNAHIDQYFKN